MKQTIHALPSEADSDIFRSVLLYRHSSTACLKCLLLATTTCSTETFMECFIKVKRVYGKSFMPIMCLIFFFCNILTNDWLVSSSVYCTASGCLCSTLL